MPASSPASRRLALPSGQHHNGTDNRSQQGEQQFFGWRKENRPRILHFSRHIPPFQCSFQSFAQRWFGLGMEPPPPLILYFFTRWLNRAYSENQLRIPPTVARSLATESGCRSESKFGLYSASRTFASLRRMLITARICRPPPVLPPPRKPTPNSALPSNQDNTSTALGKSMLPVVGETHSRLVS